MQIVKDGFTGFSCNLMGSAILIDAVVDGGTEAKDKIDIDKENRK